MSMRNKIAKALHDKMAEGSPGPKRYWETAPKEVKEAVLGYVDTMLDALADNLYIKEMDGTATLEELSAHDVIAAIREEAKSGS